MNNRSFKIAVFVYSLLALFVMMPLLAPGFVLTLDMVFVPHPPLPEYVTSSYLFHAVIHFLNYVIPGDVLQKIILFGILAGSGIGMHRLTKYLIHGGFGPDISHSDAEQGASEERTELYKKYRKGALATGNEALRRKPPGQRTLFDDRATVSGVWAYFAGVFYIINPFVYERFMTGQYAVLMGYALLPFFAWALLKFLKQPHFQSMWPLAVLVLVISIVSIHTLGLVILLTLVAVAVKIWRNHGKQYVVNVAKYGAMGIGAIFLLSSYWLVPTMLGNSRTAETIQNFSSADHQAFATDGGLLSISQLQGFWAEAQGLFILPSEPLPFSGLWQIMLWGLVAIGFTTAWRRQRDTAIIFGTSGLIAALLALGGPVNQYLLDTVPFFAGYREPHKFVALLALAYAFFGAWGLARILEAAAKRKKRFLYAATSSCLLALPFLVTPTTLWGFNGQLRPAHYPTDWYAMNDILPKNEKALFLPWHLYMNFSFTKRIVANPADKFFDAQVITGNNPEFAGISQPQSLTQNKINNEILPRAAERTNLGVQLRPFGINYILLAKELDYEDYAYLDTQSDIKLVRETPTLMLYQSVVSERSADAND